MATDRLKQAILDTAGLLGFNRLFRRINRKKLLVVMYHGITVQEYTPPIWTQLPLTIFRRQLEFLLRHYQPVSLQTVVSSLYDNRPLPERAVLITFDDGLRNNFRHAFPVLQQFGIPATIFLTVNLIGTRQLLWFDELFFLMQSALLQERPVSFPLPAAEKLLQDNRLWDAYLVMVESLKRCGPYHRNLIMHQLRTALPLDHQPLLDDFGLLDWDEIHDMQNSGLVEFGVHTATHRLLTELADHEWHQEIIAPRQKLQQELSEEITAFCYPNGRPGHDFLPLHQERLREAGYCCAFSTGSGLFCGSTGDTMAISRIAAGNDISSAPRYFAGNTSGMLPFFRGIPGRSRSEAAGAVL